MTKFNIAFKRDLTLNVKFGKSKEKLFEVKYDDYFLFSKDKTYNVELINESNIMYEFLIQLNGHTNPAFFKVAKRKLNFINIIS